MTVQAIKGKQGPCFERKQAAFNVGPFKEVLADAGHRLERDRRDAVCDKTCQLFQQKPHGARFAFIESLHEIPLAQDKPFDCAATRLRHPKETKGQDYSATAEASQCCGGGVGGC